MVSVCVCSECVCMSVSLCGECVCVCVCVWCSGCVHAWMDKERIPKIFLFGWLPERRPAHGTKLSWRDRVKKGLRSFNICR